MVSLPFLVGALVAGLGSGDRWALSVFTPSGGINFDQFYFVPSGSYPEAGLGGRIERVGDWAYVHE